MSSTHYTNSISDDDLDPIAPAPGSADASADEVSAPNADAPGPADAERFIEFLSHFQGLAGMAGIPGMVGSGSGPESDDDVYNIHQITDENDNIPISKKIKIFTDLDNTAHNQTESQSMSSVEITHVDIDNIDNTVNLDIPTQNNGLEFDESSGLKIHDVYYKNIKTLKLFVNPNDIVSQSLSVDKGILKQKYIEAAEKHNKMIDDYFDEKSSRSDYDSGFDLFVPSQYVSNINGLYYQTKTTYMITLNHEVKCSMTAGSAGSAGSAGPVRNVGYYMYPRSSISKTPFRMANCVGIIDSGYRGDLIGKFDILPHLWHSGYGSGPSGSAYEVKPFDRFTQICAGDLGPFKVEIVDELSQLELNSDAQVERGEGGIGSTGT